jgi:hypothetical protein
MKIAANLTLAAALACLLAAGGALFDGPSEAEVAAAQAADLADAQAAAEVASRFERDYRECQRLMGPDADLIQIAGTDHYVCRKAAVSPTPPDVLHRYVQLGVQR